MTSLLLADVVTPAGAAVELEAPHTE